jgi:hypothetical protein
MSSNPFFLFLKFYIYIWYEDLMYNQNKATLIDF